jgi:hypothetical protein
VTVDVLVACSAFGMVEVTLSTTGTDLDGNGCQIAVTGGREFQEFRTSVAVNTTRVTRLTPSPSRFDDIATR